MAGEFQDNYSGPTNPNNPNTVPNPYRRKLLKGAAWALSAMATSAGVYEFFTSVVPAAGKILGSISIDIPNPNNGSNNQVNNSAATETPTPTESSSAQPEIMSSFVVKANKGWQDSGVSLKKDDKADVSYISGKWTYANGKLGITVPLLDGKGNASYICAELEPSYQCTEPIGDFPKGALIGKVGSQLLKIGNQLEFTAQESGRLYLGINDEMDSRSLSDNSGSITVKIKVN